MNQTEKSANTIDFITNCAIEEFAENGVDFSLNAICKKNGISKGKLYHHFSSKEDLMCECVCRSLELLAASIDDFEVENSVSIYRNFHNYYAEHIMNWCENPNQLIVLRSAYSQHKSIFSSESLKKINQYHNNWRKTKKQKFLQILNYNNCEMRISTDVVTDILLLMYENTFQVLEDKMIIAVKSNNDQEVKKYTRELMEYHDILINMILYGAIEK